MEQRQRMPRCMHADAYHGRGHTSPSSPAGRRAISEKLAGLAENLAVHYGSEVAMQESAWQEEDHLRRQIRFEDDVADSHLSDREMFHDQQQSQRYHPLSSSRTHLLRAGQQVLYTLSDGSRTSATIVAAHSGDAYDPEPFYTIAFPDGSERETTRARLALQVPSDGAGRGRGSPGGGDVLVESADFMGNGGMGAGPLGAGATADGCILLPPSSSSRRSGSSPDHQQSPSRQQDSPLSAHESPQAARLAEAEARAAAASSEFVHALQEQLNMAEDRAAGAAAACSEAQARLADAELRTASATAALVESEAQRVESEAQLADAEGRAEAEAYAAASAMAEAQAAHAQSMHAAGSRGASRSSLEQEAAAAKAELERLRAEHDELMRIHEAERSRAATVIGEGRGSYASLTGDCGASARAARSRQRHRDDRWPSNPTGAEAGPFMSGRTDHRRLPGMPAASLSPSARRVRSPPAPAQRRRNIAANGACSNAHHTDGAPLVHPLHTSPSLLAPPPRDRRHASPVHAQAQAAAGRPPPFLAAPSSPARHRSPQAYYQPQQQRLPSYATTPCAPRDAAPHTAPQAAPNRRAGEPPPRVIAAFEWFDIQRSGVLEPSQVVPALEHCGVHLSPEAYRRVQAASLLPQPSSPLSRLGLSEFTQLVSACEAAGLVGGLAPGQGLASADYRHGHGWPTAGANDWLRRLRWCMCLPA